MSGEVLPFAAHIRELRRRAMITAAVFIAGGVVGYTYRLVLIEFLQRPLKQTLYYGSPAGGFELAMNVAVFAGILIAFPVILYQLVRFAEPAFNSKIGKSIWRYTLGGTIMAMLGLVFGYFVILPQSLHFFAEFNNDSVQSLIQARDYLRFVTNSLITFAIMFQLPLLLSIIDKNITPLPPSKLNRYQRHVIVGSLTLALILPFSYDPITQFVLAAPIVGLYELSIVLLWIRHSRARRRVRRTERDHSRLQVEPSTLTPVHREAFVPRQPVLAPRTLNLKITSEVSVSPPQPTQSQVIWQRQKPGAMLDLRAMEEQRTRTASALDLRPQN